MTPQLTSELSITLESLDFILFVSVLMGNSMVTNSICQSVIIPIEDHETMIDRILLGMQGFDVILGMNWLAVYHVSVDCLQKVVTFRP
ncbi:hypothetical protein, partial [Listeria monocytogenes]|uniref:hypothetical protein n=1 Tax=Listeria monocytogenes TaxID=1639 RepID=UPI003C6D8026